MEADSTSKYIKELQGMRDLVGNTHQLKDEKDIRRPIYTYAKAVKDRRKKDINVIGEVGDGDINDFLQPLDPIGTRKSGYSHAHVRSLLGLDTYGPKSSTQITRARSTGKLPPSPLQDRYRFGSRRSLNETPLRGTHPTASKSSLPPLYQENSNQEHDGANIQKDTQASSSSSPNEHHNPNPNLNMSLELQRRPSSLGVIDQTVLDLPQWFQSSSGSISSPSELSRVKPGTLGYSGSATYFEDFLLKDSNTKRKEWHKSYLARIKGKSDLKDARVAGRKHQEEMKIEADETRESLAKFDDSLGSKATRR